MKVIWHPDALTDWRRLSLRDAEATARAVVGWADANEGFAIAVDDEYLLFVGELVVVFFVHEDTMHVAHIRRS